jgi:cellulase/cellobiase CelA1
VPTDFVLNGTACNGAVGVTPTSVPPTITATAVPTNKPDLLIPFAPSVTLENSGCYNGEALGTRVTIRNNGTANAGTFVVDINGTQETVNGLAAGTSLSIWVSGYSNPTAIVVDANNQVAESNESNNAFNALVAVPTAPAPCVTITPTSVPPTVTAVPPTVTPPPSTATCSVAYTVGNDWGSGFTADVKITNKGTSTINGWTLTYTYAGNQTITNAWNATVTQSGKNVTATDAGWNGTLAPNGSASFGFQGSYSGSNTAPTTFKVNGLACQ